MSKCVVVGGGLAGMLAARNLARAGWQVTLFEKSDHLGGKADAISKAPGYIEHGYHVFPAWYDNTRALLDELGIPLIDFDRYHYLRPSSFPDYITVRGPSNLGAMLHDTFRNLLPWYHTFLFGYSVIDMLSRPLSDAKLLDQISQIGLIRDKWYATEAVAELNQENILKASAIPAYDMSAMTARKIASYWVKHASPFLSVLPGDLQTTYVDPIGASVAAAGVDIRYHVEVTGLRMDNGSVAAVKYRDPRDHSISGEELADVFVVTTPLEVTREFIRDEVYTADPELGNMRHLESEPMSALHIFLDYKMQSIPKEHVFLTGGHYGLSFIDNSQIWSGLPNTYLSFISSNFSPLWNLSEGAAIDAMLDEITEYLPINRSQISDAILNTNIRVPLYINTVGSWGNRPRADSQIPNLFLAGDYVKNDIDLACMEGAFSSAIEAVRVVCERYGPSPQPAPLKPAVHPRILWQLMRWGLLPAAAPTYLIAKVMERIRGVPIEYSQTKLRANPRLRR